MTREDAKIIVDLMVEKDDYELVISSEKDYHLYDYNTVFYYGWTTKNDRTGKWEHEFEDTRYNRYSDEKIIEKLMECDEYMIIDTTKTIFAWQGKKNGE